MKHTAVEWFAEKIGHNSLMGLIEYNELFEQAKEMERTQIVKAYDKGEFNSGCNETSEQYYVKTYK